MLFTKKREIQKGDKALITDFSAIHERYLPFVRTVASSYPERYRDDLVQDGVWGLYLGFCAYDPSRGVPFDAYVKVCIRNRILSVARSYSSDRNLIPFEDLGTDLPSSEPAIEDRYAEQDAFRDALRHLQPRLSDLERKVLELYLAGERVPRIAEILSVPPKSADNAMTRIKKKIKEVLASS